MHRFMHAPAKDHGLQTTGRTLHWASEYDLFTSLFGLGVNSRSSRMVVELAGVKPGDRVLDIACGSGNLTLTAHTYAGPTGATTGIDASREMIDVAQRKAARAGMPVQFRLALAEDLGLPDETFDVVMSRLAFHHLPDDVKPRALAEIARVLKPGGTVLIADFHAPSHSIFSHFASMFASPEMMQGGIGQYDAMLGQAGFVDIQSGPTRSRFLAFARGRKPARPPTRTKGASVA